MPPQITGARRPACVGDIGESGVKRQAGGFPRGAAITLREAMPCAPARSAGSASSVAKLRRVHIARPSAYHRRHAAASSWNTLRKAVKNSLYRERIAGYTEVFFASFAPSRETCFLSAPEEQISV